MDLVAHVCKHLEVETEEAELLVAKFTQQVQDALPAMHEASASGNFERLAFLLHSFKGASAALGFESLQREAALAEKEVQKSNLSAANLCILRLEAYARDLGLTGD